MSFNCQILKYLSGLCDISGDSLPVINNVSHNLKKLLFILFYDLMLNEERIIMVKTLENIRETATTVVAVATAAIVVISAFKKQKRKKFLLF
jgi:hypothetical protein